MFLGDPDASEEVATVWNVPGVQLPRVVASSSKLAELRAAIAELTQPTTEALSGRELLEETAELIRLSQQLDVVLTDQLAQVHVRGVHELDGAKSIKAWAQRINPDLTTADVKVGRDLLRWPALSTAVHENGLPLGTAAVLARALDRARAHVDQKDGLIDGQDADAVLTAMGRNTLQLIAQCTGGCTEAQLEDLVPQVEEALHQDRQSAQVEGLFVLLAKHVPASLVQSCLAEQLDALVPSVLEGEAERAHDERYLTMTRKPHGEGMRTVIDTDVETSELLHTCLQAAARRDPANPSDTATAEAFRARGQDPYDEANPVRPRSRGQRLHDALVRILEHYRDSGAAGTHDKMPVRISVTVSAELLEGRPGALPAVGASGQRIPRSLLHRWWCHAEVTAILLSRTWRVLGDTHAQRTVTGRERRALQVQNRGLCARDGCCDPDDPLTTYDPHHVVRWSETGSTNLGDTILACASLHHDLHHGRTVQLRDGRWINEQGVVTTIRACDIV